MPVQVGRGVTQGGPLLAKLFNIMVDTVVQEWLRILRDESGLGGEELDELIKTLFAIFYVDGMYIASSGLLAMCDRRVG